MIFVVGPGRCGTSTVARVLHERLRISMGTAFCPPSAEAPQGFYEDIEIKMINAMYLEGRCSYFSYMKMLHCALSERREPYGFKDPKLCYLIQYYFCLVPNPLIIRCKRSVDLCAKSYLKWYGAMDGIKTISDAITVINVRNSLLDAATATRDVLAIDFGDGKMEEPDIEHSIRNWLQVRDIRNCGFVKRKINYNNELDISESYNLSDKKGAYNGPC